MDTVGEFQPFDFIKFMTRIWIAAIAVLLVILVAGIALLWVGIRKQSI